MSAPCPFCEGFPSTAGERVGAWVPLARACAQHRDEALLPDGRPLMKTLASFARPVDGPGIALLLNPVTVDGLRAWFSVSASGVDVNAELFASADAFEFEAQHRPEYVAIAHGLHVRRNLAASGMRRVLLDWMAANADPTKLATFERLATLAVLRDHYAPVRPEAAGADPAKLLALVQRVESDVRTPASNEDTLRAVSALLSLGSTRFAHL